MKSEDHPFFVLFLIYIITISLVGNLSVFVLSFIIIFYFVSFSISPSSHTSVNSPSIHFKCAGYNHND